MLVRKNFLRPYFICPEKIFGSREKNFHPPPPSPTLFGKKKKIRARDYLKKKITNTAKNFEKKFVHALKMDHPPITFLMVRPLQLHVLKM
jgi:hypothetical protein